MSGQDQERCRVLLVTHYLFSQFCCPLRVKWILLLFYNAVVVLCNEKVVGSTFKPVRTSSAVEGHVPT